MTNGTEKQPSGWAVGYTSFAALFLITIGVFHIIAGIAGLAKDGFYVTTAKNYGDITKYFLEFNINTWGWIHLIAGIIVMLAGVALFSGAVWARTIAVIIAIASMIANFAWLPFYPLWSILIIALDIAVIWALTTHGRDIVEA
jgi:hypothetical protein